MRKTLLFALFAAFAASPALAADPTITVTDAYVRTTMMNAPTGAAFMVIQNSGATDDRLTGVASDIADKVELHTHKSDAAGVMQMVAVPEGFVIPANGTHALARGGDHVMFMGLKQPLKQGDVVALTLTFEKAGEVKVDVPVDLDRKDDMGGMTGTHDMHMMHGMPGMAAPTN